MEKFDGHSWENLDRDIKIGVGRLPYRKQICLYTIRNGEIEVLAFIKTEEKAYRILAWLDILAGESKLTNKERIRINKYLGKKK
jgi:hypothetical protein